MTSNIIKEIVKEQDKSLMDTKGKDTTGSFHEFTDKEKRIMFAEIDRHQESDQVMEFQRTGDEAIMENLYNKRLQTLQIWARKYHYVGMSEEDVFADLVTVFIKSVYKYKVNKRTKHYGKSKKAVISETPFNTYLYYALQNYIINQWNRKRAKKRMSNNVPAESITLSLDYSYNNPDDSSCSLIDVIPNKEESQETMMENIYLKETIDVLSNGNKTIQKFLKKLSNDNRLTSTLKDLRMAEGRIRLKPRQKSRFKARRKCLRRVRDFIRERKHILKDFDVVNYFVKDNFLHYKIEMWKTKEHDDINKEIRKIRRNKDRYKYLLLAK